MIEDYKAVIDGYNKEALKEFNTKVKKNIIHKYYVTTSFDTPEQLINFLDENKDVDFIIKQK